jgi:hypothetical protein
VLVGTGVMLGLEPWAEAFGWLCAQALAMVIGYGMYFELIRRAARAGVSPRNISATNP